jgi:tetratricopeptide (TPR) repeat protein
MILKITRLPKAANSLNPHNGGWREIKAQPFVVFVALLCLLLSFPAEAQRRQTRPAAQASKTEVNFDQLKAQADKAREAGRLEDAIELYRKAVTAKPNSVEAWWYLATLLYDRDRYAEAIPAFKRVTALQPQAGAPFAMLGLCEFRVGDYDNALGHIRQGRQIGIGNNRDLDMAMRYHEGMLLLLKGDFETAQNLFGGLSYENVNREDLIIAHGLAVLRLPMIPSQTPPNYRDRELIRRAGFAEHLAAQKNQGDAAQEYERLVADFPKTPGVQYAYGRYLLTQRNDEGAIAAFKKEIENSPNHALARLQIAYIHLRNKEAEAGLKFAQEAVELHARLALGRYILGRILFELGENTKAIEELETARRLAPNEPRVHFTLSRAYAKAGRKAEADQARETFARLNKIAEEAATKGFIRGEAIDENAEKGRPDSPQR